MELLFFGTGAAEGVPAMFCDCPVCENARKNGGKNIRSRAQALLDNRILLDFGPDTFYHLSRYPSANQIRNVLITHNHGDHADGLALACIKNNEKSKLDFYCGQDTAEKVRENISADKVNIHIVRAGEIFHVSEYEILPLKAQHGGPLSLLYAVSSGEKTLLYATDSGLFEESAYTELKKWNKKLNAVVLDCTRYSWHANGREHMDIHNNKQIADTLKAIGLADADTKFLLTHFAHCCDLSEHDEMQKFADEFGFIIGYDGLKVEF